MKTDKAIAHLAKKIGNNKYSSEYDKECINTIIDYIHDSREQKMNGQDLYYKLYLYLFNQFVNQYDKSEDKAQIRIHKILEMPVRFHLDQLTASLNSRQLYEDLAIEQDGNNVPQYTQERLEAYFKARLWSTTEVEENIRQMAQKALEMYL